jgi:ribosome maturation factor RimP
MKQEWLTEIRAEIERITGSRGFDLVDVILKGARPPKLLQVFLDRKGGITIEECAAVSRELSAWIDQRFPDAEFHRLEVSSPGLDGILKTRKDFERNLGRAIDIEWTSEGKSRQTVGILKSVNDETVTLSDVKQNFDGKQVFDIPAARIVWAKIKLKW